MALKRKPEEHANHERWLVSYADFITLLFAFFTVLYATAQTDSEKVNKLVGAVDRAFSVGIFAPGSNQLMFKDGAAASGSGLYDLGMSMREVENQMHLAINEKKSGGNDIQIERRSEGVSLILQTKTFFPAGSATLRPETLARLSRILGILKLVHYRLRIEGHSDSTPTRAGPSTNWALSADRALAVLTWLQDQGIPPQRLSMAGFAEFRPLVSNTTPEGRAKNRRVEIIILDDPAPFWQSKIQSRNTSTSDNLWKDLLANVNPSNEAETEEGHRGP